MESNLKPYLVALEAHSMQVQLIQILLSIKLCLRHPIFSPKQSDNDVICLLQYCLYEA